MPDPEHEAFVAFMLEHERGEIEAFIDPENDPTIEDFEEEHDIE